MNVVLCDRRCGTDYKGIVWGSQRSVRGVKPGRWQPEVVQKGEFTGAEREAVI